MDSATCPFCAAPQRHGPGPIGGFAGVLIGLALVGCGDDGSADTTAASMSQGTTETDPSTTNSTMSTTMSTTDPSGTSSTSNEEESAEVADYGSASFDSSSSGVVDSSSDSSSDSSGSTGTDTGSSSSDTGSSESADYGAAAPRK